MTSRIHPLHIKAKTMRRSSSFFLGSLRRRFALPKWENSLARKHRVLSSLGYAKDSVIGVNANNYYQHVRFSSIGISIHDPYLRTKVNEAEKRGVEFISAENVKPSSPTPNHLRSYEVSILDQLNPNVYMPLVYFYPNNDKSGPNEILKRRQTLKQSLSETLTKFYPFAGKVVDDRFIDCTDEGVYYVEAKTENQLIDFLRKPNNKSIHKLLPFVPNSEDLFSKTYLVMIQSTIFDCGGISIGIYTSHKIIDGYSHVAFLNSWAATARGCLDVVHPSFISPSVFLPNPKQSPTALAELFALYVSQAKTVTRRFVFSASSLTTLRNKTSASSSITGVAGLIWKCVMEASRTKSSPLVGSPEAKPSILVLAVNLRPRSLPPLPCHSIGNIIWPSFTQSGDVGELDTVVRSLKIAVDKVNSSYIETMKGEAGSGNVAKYLDEMKVLLQEKDVELVFVSSLCNHGIYEADFGWGKPIWASVGDADAEVSFFANQVYLMDTRSGDGIEAWVTLREGDMMIFEQDAELLRFATLNPSPLRKDHKMLHGVRKERIHNHISRESSLERIKSPYSVPSKNRSYSNCSSPTDNFTTTIDGDILEEFRAMLASEVRLKRSIQHLGDKVNANLVDIRSLEAQLTAEKEKTQQMEKENMELKDQYMKKYEQAKAELLNTIFETEEGRERMIALQKEWKLTYMTSLEYQNDLSFFSRAFLESGFNSCKAQILGGNMLDKSENLEFLDLDKAFEEALELGDFLFVMQNVKKKERMES